MSEQNVETLKGAYEAFNKGDIPAVLGVLDQGVEWTEPGGGSAPSGTFNGPESVGNDVFSKVPENFDEFECNPEEYKDEGDKVLVTGQFKGKAKSGEELDASFEHAWEFADGKVVRLENKPDQEAWAKAWGG